MNEILVIKNEVFLDILRGDGDIISEFISIIELLQKVKCKVILPINDYAEEILKVIHDRFKINEDIKIISIMFERIFRYIDNQDHIELMDEIDQLSDEESDSFRDISENNDRFNYESKAIGFKMESSNGIRNITTVDELKQLLLLFCKDIDDISTFVDKIKAILFEIIFDEDIVDSIRKLNDGFIQRKGEIILHLYIIESEIPDIVNNSTGGYRDIGSQMSISCSSEKNRDLVNNKLKKCINNVDVNCELHTKMKTISSKAPDRIYFCPALPDGTGSDLVGKIFIYKITKHA